MKAEPDRVTLQPAKLGRPGKRNLQGEVIGRTQIEGPAGVVLAATGPGAYAKDGLDALAGGELAPDDGGLTGDTAES